ncbi:TPA: ribonucleoside-diphosphate reductase subunit alpha [Klebsiella pneumoniae]|nr:ribonucleoside-diphosphate reductase subunit alpha [Klebsiella pneumoniae]
MNDIKVVVKSSGVRQPFDKEKIYKVLKWACDGHNIDVRAFLENVLELIRDGMTTKQIQRIAIKYAADHISVKEPDWQYVASNLEMFALRKDVYGQFDPIPFYDHIVKMIEAGKYDKEILEKYSKQDIQVFERAIDHDKDFEFSYAGSQQLIGKYLVQDRDTGEIFETPQYAFMLIAMCLHQEETGLAQVTHIVDFYNAISDRKLSLPTPIMAGVRTPTRQFSSCVVIESGDSLGSLNAVTSAIVKYISQRAGIGVNAGHIRAMGSKIRGGEAVHTGVIPFWKHIQTAVKSCSQGGVRGGAATLYYPFWHLEVENLLVLKNNKGVEENRVRHLDYGVQLNQLMYKRLMNRDYITLFSPDVANDRLYDLFYEADQTAFEELYESLEKDPTVRKKRIKAVDLFQLLAQERAQTGRKYIFNTHHVNQQGSFTVPVRMSNLCCEIAIPTSPLDDDDKMAGEIGLCTLMAIVLDNADISEFPKLTRIAVRALDNLLDYQNYPVKAALKAKQRRSLGVGITNYASWLASNYCDYSEAYTDKVHELMEAFQFNLLVASMELAKERGACGLYNDTKYARGLLPIDWYCKTVDELVAPVYNCDWEWLRSQIKKYGLRNSTLSALMPCESSSQVSNSTNGIEPPRGLVSIKSSKEGHYNQVVPNQNNQIDFYDLLWDMAKRGNKGYLSHVAVMQKFVDQSISANTNYDPANYEDGKVKTEDIIDDLLYANYYGVKTLYYHNTRDGAGDEEEAAEDCAGCKI